MSNLLKPGRYTEISDKRKLQIPDLQTDNASAGWTSAAEDSEEQVTEAVPFAHEQMEEARNKQREIIAEAQRQAAAIRAEAQAENEQMREDARAEIERWWAERRAEDQLRVEEAHEAGTQEGFDQGRAEAVKQVEAEYAHRLEQAQTMLERAYADKERIITEAEPFLLELSVEIAEKVIGKQLELEPEWVLDHIKHVLKRRSEHGLITLCVAPEQYEFVSDAKDDLAHVLDAQADLQIIPDKSVRDRGCIVRSQYGSMDARIDTQLTEIKQVLIQLHAGDVGTGGGHGHAEG